jgi:hypothetical protein
MYISYITCISLLFSRSILTSKEIDGKTAMTSDRVSSWPTSSLGISLNWTCRVLEEVSDFVFGFVKKDAT